MVNEDLSQWLRRRARRRRVLNFFVTSLGPRAVGLQPTAPDPEDRGLSKVEFDRQFEAYREEIYRAAVPVPPGLLGFFD